MNTLDAEQDLQNQTDNELFAILPVVEQVRILHAKGIYGFDICLQNIVMTRHGALLRVKHIALNASGSSVFRPGFTPRERYLGGTVGPWTDVYAISALVYTAMTGLMLPSAFERGNTEPLFGGLAEKYHALAEVVTQGLAPDMALRQKTLDALLAQMRVCLAGYAQPIKRTDKSNKPMNKRRTAAAALIAVLLLLCGTEIVNEVNFSQAVFHAEAGEYAQSLKSLKGVFTFYKDAALLFEYAEAGVELENAEFHAASRDFQMLGGYRNSADMVQETDYRHAQALLQQGNLTEAEQLLQSIGDYKDTYLLVNRISYENGMTYLDAGLYLSALEAFQKAEGYSDADQRIEEAKDKLYTTALSALSAGDTDTAARYLDAIPGYKAANGYAVLTELLMRAQNGDAVSPSEYGIIAGFADTIDLSMYLTSDALIDYYLRGSWQDEAGNMFELDGSGGIRYIVSGFEGSGDKFSGGVLYLGEDAVFRFTSIDLNMVEVDAIEDGSTYVLKRQ